MRKDLKKLFDVMRCQIDVMVEHENNDELLLNELLTCSNEIYNYYLDFYLDRK